MLAASSGIGSLWQDGFPPAIPPIIPLTGHKLVGAVNTHVRDLIMGMLSIVVGLAYDYVAKDKESQHYVVNWLIAFSWLFLVIPKLYLAFTDVEIV